MKKLVVVACGLLIVGGSVLAQTPVRILDQGKLDKFLTDFPVIGAEGEAAGLAVQESGGMTQEAALASGSLSAMIRDSLAGIKKNPEAGKILAVHGWDDGFWDIFFVVGVSMAALSMEEAYGGQPLPAELKPFIDDLRGAVHPEDLSLVKANQARVGAVMMAEGE